MTLVPASLHDAAITQLIYIFDALRHGSNRNGKLFNSMDHEIIIDGVEPNIMSSSSMYGILYRLALFTVEYARPN